LFLCEFGLGKIECLSRNVFFKKANQKEIDYTQTKNTEGGEISVYFQGKEAKGNVKPRNQTLLVPTVSWTTLPNALYTLLIWDPDAPSPSYIHLFATNLRSPNLSTGQTLLSYEPPSPPSGIHRYFTTVYQQKGTIDVPVPKSRAPFDVEEFVNQYSLTKVGEKMIRVRA
jgi:phosphatidylethanolamine-binding protein (PEBP) family uncharacterized protein